MKSQGLRDLDKWMALYDALSLRERLLVVVTLLTLIYFLWDALMWQPLQVQQDELDKKILAQTEKLSVLGDQINTNLAQLKINPDAEARKRLEKIQQQLKEQERQADSLENTLIAPDRMAKMLELMLNREVGLSLVKLHSIGSDPLSESMVQQVKTMTNTGMIVYKHSFEIEFEGDYFSTLQYLKALRKLPWRFFWSRFDYSVKEYPHAVVKLRLYTLSLSKEWIGV